MPLRQTHHHPDLAIYLASRAPTISAAAIQQKKRPTEHED
jgi:deoxyadenosine/deoxycytidine kinase